jgi:hypothetical protein
MLISC